MKKLFSVIDLTSENFDELVVMKSPETLWVVDFFANWCGPCLQMAGEYSRFGRLVFDVPNVKIGKVDCAVYAETCRKYNIRSYPSIMFIGQGNMGNAHHVLYPSGWSRDAGSFRQWLYSQMPSRVENLNYQSFHKLLFSDKPWIIDFFSPNCGFCRTFAPDFEDIANVSLLG